MKSRALLVMLAVAAAVPAVKGADLLDQQLGPAPAPAAEGNKTATPAVQPAPMNPADSIISPDAVRKVDDADLVNKLTQPEGAAKGEGDNVQQKMHDMVSKMDQSQKRLTDRDPGEVTQETQRRIIGDLDVLIEIARKQCNKTGDPNAEQQKAQEKQYSQAKGSSQSQGGSSAAQNSFLPRGSSAEPTTGDVRAKGPDEWGRLPAKDRDLVSHGANEEYLSSYRDMIDRYYQALAELGKTRTR